MSDTAPGGDVAAQLREGVLLFNRRRFFDCHVHFEDLLPGLEGETSIVVAGLVQIAAGLHLRFERDDPRGARSLIRQALVPLDELRPSAAGIDLDRLCAEVEVYADRLKGRRAERAGWVDRWLAPRIQWSG